MSESPKTTPGSPESVSPPRGAWRAAALPYLAVLGLVLPLTFPSLIDPYRYDFRPIELIPVYATIWLLVAVLLLPLFCAAALLLAALAAARRPPFSVARRVLAAGLAGIAAAAIVKALALATVTWLQTLGVPFAASAAQLASVAHFGSTAQLGSAIAIAAGLLAACTPRGRGIVRSLCPWALAGSILGALSLASLPYFAWGASLGSSAGLPARASPAATSDPQPPARRPNILLLTMDALSAQHMSLYGAKRPTTPRLDAFAHSAVTFDHAYANGNFTTPGVASILTGTRPWTNRALELPAWPLAATRRDSLPAVLKRAGYRTGYVSTNPYAGASRQGFGAYFDFASRDRIEQPGLCSDTLSAVLRYVCAATEMPLIAALESLADRLRAGRNNAEYDPRLAIRPALAWLARVGRQQRPVFLWVHLFPPHAPYAAPAPWLGRFDASPLGRTLASTSPYWGYLLSDAPPARVHLLESRYDESIAYVDHYAGEFLRRALALLGPDTVVVVTSDHGESFGHGYGAHTGPGLYDEIIHVPLIIKLPGETQGRRCEQEVEQVDIAPTLARLAGIPAPRSWEGHSLVAALTDADSAQPAPPVPVFSMSFEQNRRFARLTTGSVAVIDGKWKLIHYMGTLHYPRMPPLHDELYDLAADPGERDDLAAQDPSEVAALRCLIDAQLAAHGGAIVPGPPGTGEARPALGACTGMSPAASRAGHTSGSVHGKANSTGRTNSAHDPARGRTAPQRLRVHRSQLRGPALSAHLPAAHRGRRLARGDAAHPQADLEPDDGRDRGTAPPRACAGAQTHAGAEERAGAHTRAGTGRCARRRARAALMSAIRASRATTG
ncbi:MAG: sulfatase-like hydrolase/transferase [Steroidobacteraceae bacterium]